MSTIALLNTAISFGVGYGATNDTPIRARYQ